MTHDETLYIAGLLEGEGCFYNNSGSPAITLGMTDEDVVRRYQSIVGGTSIKRTENKLGLGNKTMFVTVLSGHKAIEVMKSVRPLMGLRRSQAIDDIITWYESKLRNGDRNMCKRGHDLTDSNSYWLNINTGSKNCKQCKIVRQRTKKFKIVSREIA